MAAAAADAEERAERFVGLLPGGGGRPLFVDILQWELGLDQKRKVVVRGQERCAMSRCGDVGQLDEWTIGRRTRCLRGRKVMALVGKGEREKAPCREGQEIESRSTE